MKCENCGALIEEKERYCYNCGMELLDSPPKPLKRKYHRDSRTFVSEDQRMQEEYVDYEKADSVEEAEYKPGKSGIGAVSIFLLLLVALLVGFIIGTIIFSSNTQSIPQMPSF